MSLLILVVDDEPDEETGFRQAMAVAGGRGRRDSCEASAEDRLSDTSMLKGESANGDGLRASRNVLGEPLEICSFKPMTGFYRDGCCNTGREDVGSHTICAVMTSAFLDFFKSRGNDLLTPSPARPIKN
jgi:hypothetical protein